MPLFNPSGLAKLDQLQRNVKQLIDSKEEKLEHNPSSSDYSKTIGSNAIAIIEALKVHNNDNLSNIEKIFEKLTPLISHIDNKSYTAIPVVFNEESAKLAEMFIEFLRSLDVKQAKEQMSS